MNRKIITKAFFIYIIGILVISACPLNEPPVPQLRNVTLKLNWQHGTTFLGFYMALNQGFYAEEGLNVMIEELADPILAVDIPSQVLNSEYEFGLTTSDLAAAQSIGLELTAIGNINKLGPRIFFARENLGINTPADLAGRTVIVKNQGWLRALEEFLEYADLSIDDVEVVEGGYDLTPFYEGDVEVWAGFINNEVVRVRMKGIDIVTLPLYDYGMREGAVTIFTSQEILAVDADLAVRFLRATIKGWKFAIENPSLAINEMLSIYPELTDGFEFYLASFEAAIPLIIPSSANLGDIDCNEWNMQKIFNELESTDDLCTQEIYLATLAE